MAYVNVYADVDLAEVAERADDEELRAADLCRFDSITWAEFAGCLRRRDFAKAQEMLNDIATKTGGVDLPPFVISAVS